MQDIIVHASQRDNGADLQLAADGKKQIHEFEPLQIGFICLQDNQIVLVAQDRGLLFLY